MYVQTPKLSKYLTRECKLNQLGSSITIRDVCGIKGAIYVYPGYAVVSRSVWARTTAVVSHKQGSRCFTQHHLPLFFDVQVAVLSERGMQGNMLTFARTASD